MDIAFVAITVGLEMVMAAFRAIVVMCFCVQFASNHDGKLHSIDRNFTLL